MSLVTMGVRVPRQLSDLSTGSGDQAALHARGAVIVTPNASGHNLIQPAVGYKGLRIRRATVGDTTNLQEWQDEQGTILSRVKSDGNLVIGSLSGILSATAGLVGADANLAYNATVGALVLTNYNFRSRQSSNPSWVGSIRDGEIANSGTVGGFRTIIGKNLASDDSNIDAVTAFRVLVQAGNGTEDGTAFATLQTNNAGALVNCMRLRSSGNVHFCYNVIIGDSALTATMGSSALNSLMLLDGTEPSTSGTGVIITAKTSTKVLKIRWPDGTVQTITAV